MALLDDLNRPLGEIALRNGLITDAQRDAALKVQTRAIALHSVLGEAPATVYFKDFKNIQALQNDESWKATKALHGVTPTNEAAAQERMDKRQGAPAGVPPLGQLVTTLGLLSKPEVNVLLAAQAGARAMALIEDVAAGKPITKPAEPRKDDPQFLQDAQAVATRAWTMVQSIFKTDATEKPYAIAMAKSEMKPAADKVLLHAADRLAAISDRVGAVSVDSGTNLQTEYSGAVKSASLVESSNANNLLKLAAAIKADVASRQTAQSQTPTVQTLPSAPSQVQGTAR